jgi:hypothetical protein
MAIQDKGGIFKRVYSGSFNDDGGERFYFLLYSFDDDNEKFIE